MTLLVELRREPQINIRNWERRTLEVLACQQKLMKSLELKTIPKIGGKPQNMRSFRKALQLILTSR